MGTTERGEPAERMFPGDGEMAQRMRAHPWAESEMPPPDAWPAALRTATRICLTSRFPMIVWWGPKLRFLYNDAYLPLLGTNHPALAKPGEQVWNEIWHIIGPMLESVLTSGKATWSEDLLLPLSRHGYLEETYWTYSYSPLHDDDGVVQGVFTAVSDTTERVVGERRLAVLQDLGAQAGNARSVREASDLVAAALRRSGADVPYAAVYLRRPGTDELALAAGTDPVAMDGASGDTEMGTGTGTETGTAADSTSTSTSTSASTSASTADSTGWPLSRVLRTGVGETVTDVRERFGDLPAGEWQTPPRQAVVLPLPGETGAQTIGVIVLAASAGRELDDGYESFLGLVAQQTAALVNAAVAYQVQQRRAEELTELDRAKTAFFSNISHEFRTPLTLIRGPVEELLLRVPKQEAAVREELEVIHRNSLRLGRLVTTLLDFSRIEAGRMQALYEPVDLAVFTAELAGVFRSAVEKAGLAFAVDCRALPEPVYVDRQMWEKIVLNLVSNALKFTFDGEIGVSVLAADGEAVVRITDTGIGVPPEEMPRLFERFHRIPSARARSNEGSGIGLALVRELVGLHGGSIDAQSAEGSGTAFTIRLPLGSGHLPAENVSSGGGPDLLSTSAEPFVQEAMRWLPDSAADASGSADSAETEDPDGADLLDQGTDEVALAAAAAAGVLPVRPGAARTAPRILVADDNADMREYLVRLLKPSYRVTAVPDGLAALQAARTDPPGLVVSDVMMPRMDGLELVGALRGDPRTASVPVLLLSARAGQEASIEGLEAGADDYLVKPFSAQELLARVRANVELARLRNHHAKWRTALIDSLQEGFFLCDGDGTVQEINTAFTTLLGYGAEGLPYVAPQPWWPDARSEPDARAQNTAAFDAFLANPRGSFVTPLSHRDGHRVWSAVTYNEVYDPDTGGRMLVGTLRDVTAERSAIHRETALAALSLRLARAGSVPEAVQEALEELRSLWGATRVLAVAWGEGGGEQPEVMSSPAGSHWPDLPEQLRTTIGALRERPLLSPVFVDGSMASAPMDLGGGTPALGPDPAPASPSASASASASASGPVNGAGTTLEHPAGLLTLWLDLDPDRIFGAEDQTLLALLAGSLGPALHRAHLFDQQRETSLALQRSILGPAWLPAGFAVRYEPASRPLEVGGDWYDSVELSDGRIGIVVGDCVGRGLAAATVMGQLRSACRALLLQATGPAQTLVALDHFAALVPGALCATVFCGILDPVTGSLVYSTAGHPPGILVHHDGEVELLDGGRSVPLAIRPGQPRPEATCTVPARATLLLYTDGLVERRRRSLDVGIGQAGAAVREGRAVPVEELATDLMSRLAPETGYDDDVALLLYRHPGPLDVTFRADSTELAPVRRTLRGWLERCGLAAPTIQDVLVAAGEACANAIEHGHRENPDQTVRLTASATAVDLRLTVADHGTWRTPRPQENVHRGRGTALMRAIMNQVTIEPGAAGVGGTTVTMQMRIAP